MKQILIIRGGGRPKGNTAQLVAALSAERRKPAIKWRWYL